MILGERGFRQPRPPAGRRDSWKMVSMFHVEHHVDDIVCTNVPLGTFVVAVLYVYKCTRIGCKWRQPDGLEGLRGQRKPSLIWLRRCRRPVGIHSEKM